MGKKNKAAKRKQKKRTQAKASITRALQLQRQEKLAGMISQVGRKITRAQFDAFCYVKHPIARHTIEELEWYSLLNNKLLGIVARDVTDGDFAFIILGRDSRRLFRSIDLGHDFPTIQVARQELSKTINSKYKSDGKELYPQGDESDDRLELFTEVIPEDAQHHVYKVLKNEARFEAARNLITEIANSFIDNDGHYQREFQSVGFNARLWELYLHVYFYNAGLVAQNNHPAPDFELDHFGEKVFIEAVTVNPSTNPDRPDLPPPETHEESEEHLNDFLPIKFGSPLYSKVCKKYWEKTHVKGHPLVFAIHDYHHEASMTWSRPALCEYLYGIRTRVREGEACVETIEKHSWQGKEIPSGFFNQPDSENISAVIFSNQATITKFNRMGKLAGLGCSEIKMLRNGFLSNPDQSAIHPIPFSVDVDDPSYEESWSDSLVMYHNPIASNPVDPKLFPDISHIYYTEDEGFTGIIRPYDVLSSITIVLETEKKMG